MDLLRPEGKFQIIEGRGTPPPSWRDVPSTVLARSTHSRDLASFYRVAQADVQKALAVNRRQPLLDLWSCVIGEVPPFPNALSRWGKNLSKRTLISMADATACFRGLKRPMGGDDRGFDCYAFVSKPTHRFVYEPDMACSIKLVDVPCDLVHIAYLRCDFPAGRPTNGNDHQNTASVGVITHWHFVEADPTDLSLPIDYRDRYRQRIW